MNLYKCLFAAVLYLSAASLAVAETEKSEASTDNKTAQQSQAGGAASTSPEKESTASQQSNDGQKKKNMAEYCRKNTC